jgi:hypothetical protein
MLRHYTGLNDPNNPVHMIWHHNRFMQLNTRKVGWYAQPAFLCYAAKR